MRTGIGRRSLLLAVLTVAIGLAGGCAEFVHEGHISDRSLSHPVNGVRIEQESEDGTWRSLGKTDGRGRWWILKKEIQGGRRVRFRKEGYHSMAMNESEFLQSTSLLITPKEDDGSTLINPWE